MWKLASGALVFKVKTEEGGTDLWHTTLKHKKHWIEVEADFSDLREKIKWAIDHPTKAQAIATAGQKVALANVQTWDHLAALKRVIEEVAVPVVD